MTYLANMDFGGRDEVGGNISGYEKERVEVIKVKGHVKEALSVKSGGGESMLI